MGGAGMYGGAPYSMGASGGLSGGFSVNAGVFMP